MKRNPRANILIWTRDPVLAGQLARACEHHGLGSCWAAALHEAVAHSAQHFPHAIACRLGGEAPSLLDLETLHTYQSLGSSSIALPPTPVWALCDDVTQWTARVASVELPVHVLPADVGASGLVSEISTVLPRELAPRSGPRNRPIDVLFVDSSENGGASWAGYLTTRGIWARHVSGGGAARRLLAARSARTIVCDVAMNPSGEELLQELTAVAPETPMLVMIAPTERIPRKALPRNTVGVFSKPVAAQDLEACLRRLLRTPRPASVAGSV